MRTAPLLPCLLAAVYLTPSTLLIGGTPLGERIAAANPIHHWQFPDANLEVVGAVQEVPGPDSEFYPTFPADTKAMRFSSASYLRHPSGGEKAAYQFDNGDTITLESWVQCANIPGGQNQYIIGKGRTHRAGFAVDNQNWALRLRGEGGEARLSFLFRSRDEEGEAGAFHRWTTKQGFVANRRWHHVAVTYRFGDPESIRGWIDGKRIKGRWDLGGATKRPPVVDDDEVWIGSSMGGTAASTLQGAIASVALYRHAVEGFEKAYQAISPPARPFIASAQKGRVALEVFQADSGAKEWPEFLDDPQRTLDTESFALFQLPPTYGTSGERLDQKGISYLRLHGEVTVPKGTHELLLRSPGMARLTIGGGEIISNGPARIVQDAHGPLRPILKLPYPRTRLGTTDTLITYQSDGARQTFVLEALIGDARTKMQVGELLVALNREGPTGWELFSPGTAEVPFSPAGAVHYRQREEEHFHALNTAERHKAIATSAPIWNERHALAKAYIAALPPIEVSAHPAGSLQSIDDFIAAKIATAKARNPAKESAFLKEIHPLLDEHCFRCHGEKKKGNLRLDSRDALVRGGDSGPAVVPGRPKESELLHRISATDQDERMPPKGEPLNTQEQSALRRWIADGAPWEEPIVEVNVPNPLDDYSLLRRLYLDTVGVFPTPGEVRDYLRDSAPNKYAKLIDRLLHDPRHADHWVSYWQDVLAENPRLVKPSLNNTGPFRWWIHDALRDNKSIDRFVTELVTFAGSPYQGGAAGFKLATENDVPMAAKAHVIGTAFLGVEMKCARCHDAPFHSVDQEELFSVAAMLKGAPLKVPTSSSVPKEFFAQHGKRKSRIKVSLAPNSTVKPNWPFLKIAPAPSPPDSFRTSAERLAYQITRPENRRFARVMVNRLWKRYFGQGFVEPVHDWEHKQASHPELLDFLARELVSNRYDLHHVSRLILNSESYRRAPRLHPVASAPARFFEAPLQRRLSAEQVVDSLFAATGTPFFSEELTLDVPGWYPHKTFLNLGQPRRAWQLVTLSTERDRPSLSLPHAQSLVSFLEAYGWRTNRAEPLTDRMTDPNVLQAGMIANSLPAIWWTRLSDYNDLTKLAIESASVTALIDELYLTLLTREPHPAEIAAMSALLEPGFDSRLTQQDAQFSKKVYVRRVRDISWRNHLTAETSILAAKLENEALKGPPPTDFLTSGWRELFEDAIWALINSPELQFTP